MKINVFIKAAAVIFLGTALAGCSFVIQTGRRSDVEKIRELNSQLNELSQTKKLLEERLSQEIGDKQISLKLKDKGLVITFVADVLFDSGKAEIRRAAYNSLDKVARVLQENVPDLNVGIEGHTDNIPIKLSRWGSNWELSTARALSVLHYLVDKKGISGDRVSAIGYGEYRPVASNDTKEGRQLNRRVEIVILPQVTKIKDSKEETYKLKEPEENLK